MPEIGDEGTGGVGDKMRGVVVAVGGREAEEREREGFEKTRSFVRRRWGSGCRISRAWDETKCQEDIDRLISRAEADGSCLEEQHRWSVSRVSSRVDGPDERDERGLACRHAWMERCHVSRTRLHK